MPTSSIALHWGLWRMHGDRALVGGTLKMPASTQTLTSISKYSSLPHSEIEGKAQAYG